MGALAKELPKPSLAPGIQLPAFEWTTRPLDDESVHGDHMGIKMGASPFCVTSEKVEGTKSDQL